jgi:hypothetical protein
VRRYGHTTVSGKWFYISDIDPTAKGHKHEIGLTSITTTKHHDVKTSIFLSIFNIFPLDSHICIYSNNKRRKNQLTMYGQCFLIINLLLECLISFGLETTMLTLYLVNCKYSNWRNGSSFAFCTQKSHQHSLHWYKVLKIIW